MTARSRILKAVLGTSFSRIVLIVSQLVTVPLLIFRWGSAAYGAWLAVTALTSYLNYSAVGLAPALRSDLALNLHKGGEAAMRTTFQTSLVALVSSTGLACAGFIVALYASPLLSVFHLQALGGDGYRQVAASMALSTVSSLVFGVVAAAIAALGAFGLSQTIDAVRALTEAVLLIVLVGILDFRPVEMAWVYPFTGAASLIVGVFALLHKAPWLFAGLHLHFGVFKRLIRPMMGAMALNLGYAGLIVQAPRLIIAAALGPSAVAVFALTTMMLRMARIPIEIPAFATTVEISLSYGRSDLMAAREFLATGMRFTVWLAALILPVVLCLGVPAATIWSAGRIHVPLPVLAVLCGATLAYAVGLPCQEALMALNKLALATTWLAAFSIPFLVICTLMSHSFGLVGASLSVLLLEGVFAVTTLAMTLRSLRFGLSDLVAQVRRPPIDVVQNEISTWRTRFARARA